MSTNIQNGLEHLPQTPPPDRVWEHIEQQLDKQKRRLLPLWFRYTMGAAATFALLACAWVLYNNMEQDATAVAPQPKIADVVTKNNADPAIEAQGNGTIKASKKEPLNNEANRNVINTQVVSSFSDTSLTTIGTFLTIQGGLTMNHTSFAPPSVQNFSATAPLNQTYNWSFEGNDNVLGGSVSLHNYSNAGSYTIETDANRLNYQQSDNVGYLDAEDTDNDGTYNLVESVELGNVSLPENGELIRGNQSLFGFRMKAKDELLRDKNNTLELHGDSVEYEVPYEEEPVSTESYAPLIENEFLSPFKEPLSTFGIDVDNASYSNARRMVGTGEMPPKDAVRIEEFVNYFDYNYPQPKGEDPFSINLETASCPWNKDTRIVSIALQGKDVNREQLPASNLVFLIDVSGSMDEENKLPMVKKSLKLLVDQMRPQDKIAIVTYAGAAGLALPSTACSQKNTIKDAIDNLDAGGSTAGGEGIVLAYKVAGENKTKGGNNRIILVTDGDFNVGQQTDTEMETLIEQKRKEGIALTVCGFGMGNYKDSKMEILADKGNGNYYYIDNFKESKKVFVTALTGTLFTIAKDVKIQVEFNPKFVKAYRLIGYENRKMPPQDFHDDTKDGGELGAGHRVTALYEIIPVGSKLDPDGFMELKYQNTKPEKELKDYGTALLTVKLRYKKPDEETSKLLENTLANNTQSYEKASGNLRYACGVATYAMLLRDSKFKGEATYTLAKNLLNSTDLNIANGYREELLQLISMCEELPQ